MIDTVFETDRLFIRPTQKEDAAFIFELMNSPKWLEHIGNRKISSVEIAESYILSKMKPQFDRLRFSNNTVIHKETGEKMGVCGLYDREGVEGVDLGFAFLPQFEKQGYAFESAQKVLELGFTIYNFDKISAFTTPENQSSQKLLEKLGFTYIKNVFIPNDPVKLRLYELEKHQKI